MRDTARLVANQCSLRLGGGVEQRRLLLPEAIAARSTWRTSAGTLDLDAPAAPPRAPARSVLPLDVAGGGGRLRPDWPCREGCPDRCRRRACVARFIRAAHWRAAGASRVASASRRNSAVYAGRVFVIDGHHRFAPSGQAVSCPSKRGNSTAGRKQRR